VVVTYIKINTVDKVYFSFLSSETRIEKTKDCGGLFPHPVPFKGKNSNV